MYTPHFVYSPINGHLGFPFLAIVNNAVQASYKYLLDFLLSILLGLYPEMELLGHMVILCLIFSETIMPFFTVPAHFMLLPTMHRGSNFSTSLPTFLSFFFFFLNYSHLNGCEVVSHCGFGLCFSD